MSPTAFHPALRADLIRLPPDAEGEALRDPVLNRRVNLGPVARTLVPLLDGTHSVEEVLAAAPEQEARRALRTLLLTNLIEGAGDAILARARAVQAREVSYDPLTLPGTRFQCQGSGECCRSYAFGPLRDEDVARIAALPVEERYPYLGPGPYVDPRPMRDGSQRPYLRTFGQECLFHLPDGRCGLHAAFGEDAKPALCRLYPYQQAATIFGRKIYDRSECSTFAVSAGAGTPLAGEELARVLALLQEPDEIYHPLVILPDGLPCDYGHFFPLQEALCAALGEPGGGGALGRLRLSAAWLRAFCERVSACPLAPGEPTATVDGVLARRPAVDGMPEAAERPEGLLRLASLAAALRDELVPHRMVIERARSQRRAHQQLLDLDEALLAVQALAGQRAGGPAPPQRLAGLLDVSISDPFAGPVIDDALRLSLRGQLFSDRVLVEDRVAAGLLRALLVQVVALTRARIVAAARGSARVSVPDFNAGHTLAIRVLNQEILDRVFVQHEASAWELVEAAAPFLS